MDPTGLENKGFTDRTAQRKRHNSIILCFARLKRDDGTFLWEMQEKEETAVSDDGRPMVGTLSCRA